MKGKKKMKKYVIQDKALKTVVDRLVGVSVEDFEDEGDGIREDEGLATDVDGDVKEYEFASLFD